tara:strand:- start:2257 stop:3399 length:1143 start_codon:yes stop_codon:yes gene_type:complete
MKDLALELCRLGHQPIVITPTENFDNIATHDKIDGIQIFRVKTNKTTNVSFLFRGLNEIFLPFIIINAIRKSNLSLNKLDAVIWYSPTIFFGPVVHFLKKMSGCQTYLILRDIFPEWALDLGVLKKNPIYFFFKIVAKYQYFVADIIGVQSPSNLKYFKSWCKKPKRKLEVLNNWLSQSNQKETKISFTNTDFNRKKLFVYAGNMGIAQGMDIFIELADSLKNRKDLGFIFVGRGSEVNKLKKLSANKKLDNVLFFDEVSPEEIPSLLKMCHVGLVALDLRHKSHNIPGKFLTYLQAELPVLAKINFGNDLQYIIENENVGLVYSGNVVEDLSVLATKIIDDEINYKAMSKSCKSLFKKMFSTNKITNQIISSLSENLNK